MKNKFLILAMMMVLLMALISCTANKPEVVEEKEVKTEETQEAPQEEMVTDTPNDQVQEGLAFEVRELGISMVVPAYWEEKIENIMPLVKTPEYMEEGAKEFGSIEMTFVPVSTLKMIGDQEALTDPEEIQAFNEKVMATVRPILSIMVYDKNTEGLSEDPEALKALTGFDVNESLGEKGNLLYFLSYDVMNTDDLDEASKIIFEEASKGIEKIKSTTQLIEIGMSPQKAASEGRIADFNTKDIKGNDVDNSIFAGSKVTMINFWGTYCDPCISEMEDLEALSHELIEVEAQLIGIVVDGTSPDSLELANIISDQKGVTFTSIVPDNAINVSIMQSITAVPTSIFVDSEGNVIGEPIIGVRSKEDYFNAVKALLDDM